MIPKEKAIELVDKLTLSSNAQDGSWMCKDLAKQCALIAVDEIIEFLIQASEYLAFPEQIKYWQQVKQEIEKL